MTVVLTMGRERVKQDLRSFLKTGFSVLGIRNEVHYHFEAIFFSQDINFLKMLKSASPQPFLKFESSFRENIEEEMEERWDRVKKEIELRGTYDLDEKELVFGARLAWRNAARCIGRIQWKKLQV